MAVSLSLLRCARGVIVAIERRKASIYTKRARALLGRKRNISRRRNAIKVKVFRPITRNENIPGSGHDVFCGWRLCIINVVITTFVNYGGA